VCVFFESLSSFPQCMHMCESVCVCVCVCAYMCVCVLGGCGPL